MKQTTKYIFVTGGVLSGVGKGITAASLAKILKSRGLKVNIQKCDPYLNTDAGTLNPAEHGEVFVTVDGAEADLDLGHYERFLNQELTQSSSLMSGKILSQVIADERAGKYLGKTVQIIPHVTNAIQDAIAAAGAGYDVHFVEIGGTVGDYEGQSFLEAIREFKQRVGAENVLYLHVVYLPFIEASKEVKTKPAQNAVRTLRGYGINPDVLVARSERESTQSVLDKLSLYSDVEAGGICVVPTVESVYEVPLRMGDTADFIIDRLQLKTKKENLGNWHQLVERAMDKSLPQVRIGVVAKYMDHEDTYMSVFEALKAAGWAEERRVDIDWIDSEELEVELPPGRFEALDGIIVPGGFGSRGVEGKIKAATWAIERGTPYLGLCLGMQVAVIALARLQGKTDANSIEFDSDTPDPVISLMNEQKEVVDKGGTMRLGNWECVLGKGSLAHKLYGRLTIAERHRHRYEFNNAYKVELEAAGMVFSGTSPDGKLVELIELAEHPFFIASQFHPEFSSRPEAPNPLFRGLIQAARSVADQR
ncbi:MAG: CTP synthase [Candidatus Saccharimonadales bacterium]